MADFWPMNGDGVNVSVQYLGGVNRWPGIQVRDAKESVDLQGDLRGVASMGWVSYEACHRSNDESSSGSGRVPVNTGCISSGSSRLKRPSVCVRSCRSMACWNKTKVHVAGASIVVLLKGL